MVELGHVSWPPGKREGYSVGSWNRVEGNLRTLVVTSCFSLVCATESVWPERLEAALVKTSGTESKYQSLLSPCGIGVAGWAGGAFSATNISRLPFGSRLHADDFGQRYAAQRQDALQENAPRENAPQENVLQENAQQEELERLLVQLGDDDFLVREQAMVDLATIGTDALEFLRQHEQAADYEIRSRVQKLVLLLEASERERLLVLFLESDDPSESFGLAGWEKFSSVAGYEKNVREAFVALTSNYPQGVKSLEADTEEIVKQFLSIFKSSQLQNRVYGPGGIQSESDFQLLLLFVVMAQVDLDTRGDTEALDTRSRMLSTQLLNWCTSQTFAESLKKNKGLAKLVFDRLRDWIQDEDHDASLLSYRMRAAANLEMKQAALQLARQSLEGNATNSNKTQELVALGRYGSEADLELCEKFLDQKRRVQSLQANGNFQQVEIFLCDIALISALKISEQSPSDYGMLELVDYGSSLLPTHGFATEEQRDSALKKWKEYRQKN